MSGTSTRPIIFLDTNELIRWAQAAVVYDPQDPVSYMNNLITWWNALGYSVHTTTTNVAEISKTGFTTGTDGKPYYTSKYITQFINQNVASGDLFEDPVQAIDPVTGLNFGPGSIATGSRSPTHKSHPNPD